MIEDSVLFSVRGHYGSYLYQNGIGAVSDHLSGRSSKRVSYVRAFVLALPAKRLTFGKSVPTAAFAAAEGPFSPKRLANCIYSGAENGMASHWFDTEENNSVGLISTDR